MIPRKHRTLAWPSALRSKPRLDSSALNAFMLPGFSPALLAKSVQEANSDPGRVPLVLVAGLGIAGISEPLRHQVLVLEVALGGPDDAGGPHQAVRLPVETALDHPSQDARPFGLELLFKQWVRLGRYPVERHKVEPAPRGVVDILQEPACGSRRWSA